MIPEDFRCPISLEIMSDPVILSSGHTFDRSSIQRWLDSGHLTCPISNLPLNPSPPLLIPNHTLRKLISHFTPTTSSKPQLCHSDLIRQLHSPPHLRLQALKLLLQLSLNDDAVKVGLVADGAVDRIVECLVNETPALCSLAATLITSLAVADVNKCSIGCHPKAIFCLVGVLRDEKRCVRERKEAATALYVLCGFSENRRRMVRYGAVPVLVELAESGLERAVEVLALVGKCKEGRVEMGKIQSFVQIMVGIVDMNWSGRAVENALIVLQLLFGGSDDDDDDDDDDVGSSNLCANHRLFEVLGRLIGEEEENGNGNCNGKVGRNARKLLQTLNNHLRS